MNHGFWLRIDGNPELRTEPALDAWQRLRGYLRRTLSDEVNHGFWLRIDGNPELRTEPALDAWQRLRGYLRRTLSD